MKDESSVEVAMPRNADENADKSPVAMANGDA
jgi:hypothetical protein